MEEGFRLMAVGMTTVFSFLSLLVIAIQISAAFFDRFAHLFPEPEPTRRALSPSSTTSSDPEIAVVLAAIAAHHRS